MSKSWQGLLDRGMVEILGRVEYQCWVKPDGLAVAGPSRWLD